MHIYSAIINLAGSQINQVRKKGLTAPDVIMLRHVHGSDAVNQVKELHEDRLLKGAHVRNALIAHYGEKRVEALFGPSHQVLPHKLTPDQLGDGLPPPEEGDGIPGEAPDLDQIVTGEALKQKVEKVTTELLG